MYEAGRMDDRFTGNMLTDRAGLTVGTITAPIYFAPGRSFALVTLFEGYYVTVPITFQCPMCRAESDTHTGSCRLCGATLHPVMK